MLERIALFVTSGPRSKQVRTDTEIETGSQWLYVLVGSYVILVRSKLRKRLQTELSRF